MRLNVGAGDFYAPGWVNLDLETCPHQRDMTGSVLDLPLPDGSCDQVYAGHVLEHVPLDQVAVALREIHRVLHAGGQVLAVGPGNGAAGGNRWPGDEHQWACTPDVLFSEVAKVFDACAVPVGMIDDVQWPLVSRAAWQCAVLGTR